MASPTTHDECPSLSSVRFLFSSALRRIDNDSYVQIVPTFYERATPSTTTTATTSLPSSAPSREHFHADQIFSDHNHRTNIYEEILPSSYDYRPHCACCSCTHAHYYEKHSVPPSFSTPYYHTYEPSVARIVCQTCLFQSLHRQQQCSCHHFFVPIK